MLQQTTKTYRQSRAPLLAPAPTVYTITSFPKEFRKNWFANLDQRYLAILAATFIVTISLLLTLQSLVTYQNIDAKIRNYHSNYAQLLLNNSDFLTDATLLERNDISENHLYGVENEIDQPEILTASQKRTLKNNSLSEQAGKISQDGKPRIYKTRQPAVNPVAARPQKSVESDLLEIIQSANSGTDPVLGDLESISSTSSEQLSASLSAILNASDKSISANDQRQEQGYSVKRGHISHASFQQVINKMSDREQITYQNISRNTRMETITESDVKGQQHNLHGRSIRSSEQITAVIVSHNQTIQDCYKQILKIDPSLKGKIVLRFSVTPAGTIENVAVIQSTLDNRQMERCIIRRIKRWNDFGRCDPDIGNVYYRQTYVFGF